MSVDIQQLEAHYIAFIQSLNRDDADVYEVIREIMEKLKSIKNEVHANLFVDVTYNCLFVDTKAQRTIRTGGAFDGLFGAERE